MKSFFSLTLLAILGAAVACGSGRRDVTGPHEENVRGQLRQTHDNVGDVADETRGAIESGVEGANRLWQTPEQQRTEEERRRKEDRERRY